MRPRPVHRTIMYLSLSRYTLFLSVCPLDLCSTFIIIKVFPPEPGRDGNFKMPRDIQNGPTRVREVAGSCPPRGGQPLKVIRDSAVDIPTVISYLLSTV